MKKLILVFGIFAIVFAVVSATFDNINPYIETQAQTKQVGRDDDHESYTVKSENGRVVVYKGDELLIKTSTAVSTLPKKDEKELLYGITVYSKEEMNKLLEQYCS